ncbi:serpin B6-like [Mixophyes fleayi]|uniref:serpin B6-like n=1 Tax=Mixophyes fleayi TaxID=3061075 RepID=UPI003F4E3101
MEALTAANNKFSVKLYKNLIDEDGQNIFFSPWSISSVLTMVYLGAKGNTELQMAEVLNFKKAADSLKCQNPEAVDISNIPQVFEELLSHINQPSSKYTMKTANRLYSEKSFPIILYYTKLIEKHFHAEIQAVDFLKAAEKSRKKINSWVKGQTEGKIKDLLAPGSIDALTRLVLVNAVYFKGDWDIKFPEENTEQRPFRMSKAKSKPVPMMFQRNKFNMFYIEEMETKVLELPFVGNELSMIILLPDDIKDNSTGLEQLEKELSYEKLSEWTKAEMMEKTEVEVELPRFRLEENYDLKSQLRKMGLSDPFDAHKADFTGMAVKGQLYVSQIVHKARVEVNEDGTEAAAATAAIVTVRMRPTVVNFQADHPFMIMIKHQATNLILFLGRYVSP